jgi:hypothetical protein
VTEKETIPKHPNAFAISDLTFQNDHSPITNLDHALAAMRTDAQDAVCAFVREILSARTGETIVVTDRPDREPNRTYERWRCTPRMTTRGPSTSGLGL